MLFIIGVSHVKRVPSGHNRTYWMCKCECGKEKAIGGVSLKNGDTISCGCFGSERRRFATSTHRQTRTRCYNTWRAMKDRCYNKKSSQYADYGGRGIGMCKQWEFSFETFLKDMGEPEKGMTIERIRVDESYSPDNCIWATRKQQARNKRNNRMIHYDDVTLCMAEWAQRICLSYSALQARLDRGWSIERALTTKPGLRPRNARV